MIDPIQRSSPFPFGSNPPTSVHPIPFENGASSSRSMEEDREEISLFSRIGSHIVYPVSKLINWLCDRILFRESEMEMAEELMEDALVGVALMVYDRSKGEDSIKRVIATSEILYEKMTKKWFPYNDTNRFMRQKLAGVKMGALALLGREDEVKETRKLLEDLGFPFEQVQMFEDLIALTLKLTTPSKVNRAKCFAINMFIQTFVSVTCVWKRDNPPNLIFDHLARPIGLAVSEKALKIGHIERPFLWRIGYTAFALPRLLFIWFISRVSLSDDEMKEAEGFLESGFKGMAFLSLERSEGSQILKETIEGLGKFDQKLQKKWFSYSKGNVFVRQKLLKFRLGLAALSGNAEEIAVCRRTLKTLGFNFPRGRYQEWIDNLLKNTTPSRRNDWQFKCLNTIVQLVTKWS